MSFFQAIAREKKFGLSAGDRAEYLQNVNQVHLCPYCFEYFCIGGNGDCVYCEDCMYNMGCLIYYSVGKPLKNIPCVQCFAGLEKSQERPKPRKNLLVVRICKSNEPSERTIRQKAPKHRRRKELKAKKIRSDLRLIATAKQELASKTKQPTKRNEKIHDFPIKRPHRQLYPQQRAVFG